MSLRWYLESSEPSLWWEILVVAIFGRQRTIATTERREGEEEGEGEREIERGRGWKRERERGRKGKGEGERDLYFLLYIHMSPFLYTSMEGDCHSVVECPYTSQ